MGNPDLGNRVKTANPSGTVLAFRPYGLYRCADPHHIFSSHLTRMQTSAHVEEKPVEEYVEDTAAKHDDHAEAILPESLRGLSEEERNVLEKKMVRKMDMIIL